MAKQSFVTGQVLTAAQLTSLQQTAMSGGAASAKTANYTLVAADAGTAISMTSTSATTITVNTGLFAAGDTVFIQNLGTANCTITAGTATVNTAGSLILPQYDAGILYFVSASSAVFYDYIQTGATSPLTTKGDLYGFGTSDARIPIGTNGQILTADSAETLGLKWAAPAGGSTFAGCYLTTATAQSLTNNTLTAITFAGETFDTDTYHSTSSNTSRITIPAGKAGYYLFTALQTYATNGTGVREVRVRKNGVSDYFGACSVGANSSDGVGMQISVIMNLAEGDYVEQFALQTSGGALNAESGSRFACTFLGA